MAWQTVIALLLLAYAIGFWMLWGVVRDASDAIAPIKQATDRYQSMTRGDR